jgi:hypothetical protein
MDRITYGCDEVITGSLKPSTKDFLKRFMEFKGVKTTNHVEGWGGRYEDEEAKYILTM